MHRLILGSIHSDKHWYSYSSYSSYDYYNSIGWKKVMPVEEWEG